MDLSPPRYRAEMPRDPERIYQAQRAGIFRRLVDAERLSAFDAEHWISRWEREAEESANGPAVGSQGYWDAAWRCTAASTDRRAVIERPRRMGYLTLMVPFISGWRPQKYG